MKGKNSEKCYQQSFWIDQDITYVSRIAERFLGKTGKIRHLSEAQAKPTLICNASLFDAKGTKIWFGDIDIDVARSELLKLSAKLGVIYILYETDGNFLDYKPSSAVIRKVAPVIVERGQIFCRKDFAERVRTLKDKMSFPQSYEAPGGAL